VVGAAREEGGEHRIHVERPAGVHGELVRGRDVLVVGGARRCDEGEHEEEKRAHRPDSRAFRGGVPARTPGSKRTRRDGDDPRIPRCWRGDRKTPEALVLLWISYT